MSAVDIACELAKKFEGFRSNPYLCPAGVPTIGYGSTYYADGKKVTMQDASISEPAAFELLKGEMKKYLAQAEKVSPVLKTQSDNRRAAIADFVYNLGVTNYSVSTLRKKIDAGDWESAKIEIKKWNKGGGKVLAGLVARREAEADLM